MTTNNSVNVKLSGSTGTGNFVGSTSPSLVTPALGTPSSGILTNCTSIPAAGVTGTLGLSHGGTGVSTVTTTPTSLSWAAWDGHENMQANNFVPFYTTTANSGGTTTLTNTSTYNQYFTGSGNQTVVMPTTATLFVGESFNFVNSSSGTVTLTTFASNTIQVMAAGTTALLTSINNASDAASSWNVLYAKSVGGGSGTVNSGTSNQLAYYSSTGTAVSGLASVNNGVFITNGSGVPSSSTTLPSGLSATNLALTTPTLGVATATSLAFSPTTGGIIGTINADNATPGDVGEYISNTGTGVSLSSATAANICTISLTAGDWDVQGVIGFIAAGTTTVIQIASAINTLSATLPAFPVENDIQLLTTTFGTGSTNYLSCGPTRINVSSTTTIYLVARSTFSVSTMTASGFISARRVR